MDRVAAQMKIDALNVEGLSTRWCPATNSSYAQNCICYVPAYCEAATPDGFERIIRYPRCNNKSLMGENK